MKQEKRLKKLEVKVDQIFTRFSSAFRAIDFLDRLVSILVTVQVTTVILAAIAVILVIFKGG